MEADLAIGPVTPTEDRFSVAEPLPHYFETTAGHAAGRLVSFRTNVSGHIGGFDTQIWLIIAALVVFLSCGLSLRGQPKNFTAFKGRLYDRIFEMLGNLVLEASPRTTMDPHIRIVIAFWWLMLIVLMNTFTGHMKASMTVQEELPRLDSVQDVVDHPDVTPVIIRGSTFEEVFQESTRRDHQLLLRRARQAQSVLPPRQIFTKSVFDDVLAGRKVIFLDTMLFHYWVGRFYERLPHGEFYLAREAVLYPAMCMWLNRNVDPQLARVIHIRTRWIAESGLAQRWKYLLVERSQRKSGGLSDSQGQPLSMASSLQLQDIAAVMQLLVAGLCVALITFLAELVVSSRCSPCSPGVPGR
ncbi:hypothetical protein IscW_ISCW015107 [Ixodes scapularis]|uniref:Ionotropic glutamate receptor C-terminal domain-containing protein n=1 Tax=Ixodes scapularis TaxID=6945 RepID=B7QNK5_IXOSC|nr:hypothetical protein IscW_ISCW015107 [Ixodes scapularis]|eukprot:XP_002416510.1 hypothetical protein IscW_ISCW015107 [Ixodes scapularis]